MLSLGLFTPERLILIDPEECCRKFGDYSSSFEEERNIIRINESPVRRLFLLKKGGAFAEWLPQKETALASVGRPMPSIITAVSGQVLRKIWKVEYCSSVLWSHQLLVTCRTVVFSVVPWPNLSRIPQVS